LAVFYKKIKRPMGLTMKEKKAVSKEIAKRYKKARKREKGKILDEFTKLTNYSKCHASCHRR